MKTNQKWSARWNVVTLIAAAMLGLSVSSVTATMLYTYTGPGDAYRTDANDTPIGLKFTVRGTNIAVRALGVWDQSGDGLNAAHEMFLWDAAGDLLASNTVAAGTSTLVSGFEFATGLFKGSGSLITDPLILTVGNSYYLTEVQAGSEPFLDFGAPVSFASYVTTAGAIVGTPPVGTFGGTTFVGPNLQFDALIPEPGTIVLFGIGGLVLWLRRRNR